jgi:hypothetical protein
MIIIISWWLFNPIGYKAFVWNSRKIMNDELGASERKSYCLVKLTYKLGSMWKSLRFIGGLRITWLVCKDTVLLLLCISLSCSQSEVNQTKQ